MKPSNGTVDSWQAEFEGKRALVTGATGFIGRTLCQDLVALGTEVWGLSRSGRCPEPPAGVRWLQADLREHRQAASAFAESRPDWVFHLAGEVTGHPGAELVLSMLESNVLGTVHLFTTALDQNCKRILFASSPEAAGRGTPGSPYAASKLTADLYAGMFHRLYGLPVICLRPFLTYGAWQDPSKLIPSVILSLLQGKAPLLSSGNRVVDAIHVEDVARGFLAAAVAPSSIIGNSFDLGTGKGISIRELAETLARLVGSDRRPQFGALADRPGEQDQVADVGPTQSALRWAPRRTLEEGLRETIGWYRKRAQGPVERVP